MSQKKTTLALLTGILLALAGCSSPNEPTRANFERAILERGALLKPCIDVASAWGGKAEYPVSVQTGPKASIHDQQRLAIHELLVAMGLETGDANVGVFNISPEGKKFLYREDSVMGKALKICFGEVKSAEVTKIISVPFPGIYKVEFKYQVTNLPDWAKTNKAQIEKLTERSIAKLEGDIQFRQTDTGWIGFDQVKPNHKSRELVG